MRQLRFADSIGGVHLEAPTNLNEKIALKTNEKPSEDAALLLEKMLLERKIEEENKKNNIFILQLTLFVSIGLGFIYFYVENSFA